MEKYYTPSIEEFYVGFEYEAKCPITKEWTEFEVDLSFGSLWFASANDTRVKHLDRDCIESLEWLYTGKSVANWYKLRGEFEIGNWTAYEAIMIHDPSCNWVKIHVLDRGDEVDIFQGTIKNKSELKKLLKQLGI